MKGRCGKIFESMIPMGDITMGNTVCASVLREFLVTN